MDYSNTAKREVETMMAAIELAFDKKLPCWLCHDAANCMAQPINQSIDGFCRVGVQLYLYTALAEYHALRHRMGQEGELRYDGGSDGDFELVLTCPNNSAQDMALEPEQEQHAKDATTSAITATRRKRSSNREDLEARYIIETNRAAVIASDIVSGRMDDICALIFTARATKSFDRASNIIASGCNKLANESSSNTRVASILRLYVAQAAPDLERQAVRRMSKPVDRWGEHVDEKQLKRLKNRLARLSGSKQVTL